MTIPIKVAACQMQAELGNVPENLARAERLIDEAFAKGARWVILPEFFPAAMAFHPSILHAALPFEGPALRLLTDAARRHSGFVGGSFVAIKGRDRYNTFVLVGPDGRFATHDKSIPTWWENCYYIAGDDEGVFTAGDARVGMALCWELALWRTAKRLHGKVDFVVGGSAWCGLPRTRVFKGLIRTAQAYSFGVIKEAPKRLARVLGVPVVHASMVGPFRGRTPLVPGPYDSFFQGESQIVAGDGHTLARRACEEGPGIVLAELDPTPIPPREPMGDGLWIRLESAPLTVRAAFNITEATLMLHGKLYYKLKTRRRSASVRARA